MATIKLSSHEISKFLKAYAKFKINNTNKHALAMFKFTDCTITVFKTGNILFQGPNAEKSAAKWGYKVANVKTDVFSAYIGSDEVGTGDFFGPIVVVAAFVNEETSIKLKKIGVDDSKKFNDSRIIELAGEIKKIITWESSIINNSEYNQAIKKINMNEIKAFLHNNALIKLSKKVNYEAIIMDEFASKKNYFKYLESAKEVVKDIIFVQKAESKYIAVAAASIIARSIFLDEMRKISEIVGFDIQLGAGSKVDQQIKLLNEIQLEKVGKLNFKNYTKKK